MSEIKWVGRDHSEPQRFHDGDAGFDLVCSEGAVIKPGAFRDIDCGIHVEMPVGVWALITGRSSTLRERGLMVAQGIIDNGYRGPLFAGVWNLRQETVRVAEGERLAQFIPYELTAARLEWRQVRNLNGSDRGHAGFGSTGRR